MNPTHTPWRQKVDTSESTPVAESEPESGVLHTLHQAEVVTGAGAVVSSDRQNNGGRPADWPGETVAEPLPAALQLGLQAFSLKVPVPCLLAAVEGGGDDQLRVRFHIIRNARIENVGKSQSCMVSKLRIIWKQTVAIGEEEGLSVRLPLPVEWAALFPADVVRAANSTITDNGSLATTLKPDQARQQEEVAGRQVEAVVGGAVVQRWFVPPSERAIPSRKQRRKARQAARRIVEARRLVIHGLLPLAAASAAAQDNHRSRKRRDGGGGQDPAELANDNSRGGGRSGDMCSPPPETEELVRALFARWGAITAVQLVGTPSGKAQRGARSGGGAAAVAADGGVLLEFSEVKIIIHNIHHIIITQSLHADL